jgi:hypothetical protein
MDNRFFGWLSVCWGFFSSCLCFAAPAADEVRAAWRASPTVAIPPLGWRDPASGGLYSDPHGRRRLAESLTVSTPPRSGYDASRGRILSPWWAAVPGTQGFVWLTTSA